ncbi:hypothetical protein RQ831_16170 [Roseomonas gilardii]|uniref:Uncharacterized protein n=1 Tax=Roseomonas gilardii TaxID=257708 RepID=A0A1L7AIM2_9PROT|nr:hypothetical protein [Roseomonas gilardii]APT58550.1 hypothetical protein RGI145_16975 [Roseomonas gilardii]MDT8332594.1 hypothetical protein [Roseomonas gilardii]
MDQFQSNVIDRLARIETKQDAILPVQIDHEKRIAALETLKNKYLGAVFVVSSLAATAVSGAIAYLTKG